MQICSSAFFITDDSALIRKTTDRLKHRKYDLFRLLLKLV